jgi:hypothetical protein
MLVIIVGGALLAALFDFKFGAGLLFGGALALLNYKWLCSSIRAALSSGGAGLRFVFRWIVVGAIAYAACCAWRLNAVSVVLGLMAPAPAIMVEAAYLGLKYRGDSL